MCCRWWRAPRSNHVAADTRINSTLDIHTHTPQHTATHCSTLQHTATHCNTLQHIGHTHGSIAQLSMYHRIRRFNVLSRRTLNVRLHVHSVSVYVYLQCITTYRRFNVSSHPYVSMYCLHLHSMCVYVYIRFLSTCKFNVSSHTDVSIHRRMERWGAGVEYHFQEFN